MARYTPNHAGVAAYLNTSPELRALLQQRAMLGASAAQALAPRRTGALARSIQVTDDGPNQGAHHDRMQFSVVVTVPYAVPASFPDPQEQAYLDAAIRIMEAGR